MQTQDYFIYHLSFIIYRLPLICIADRPRLFLQKIGETPFATGQNKIVWNLCEAPRVKTWCCWHVVKFGVVRIVPYNFIAARALLVTLTLFVWHRFVV